jgi:hypothetical protein
MLDLLDIRLCEEEEEVVEEEGEELDYHYKLVYK